MKLSVIDSPAQVPLLSPEFSPRRRFCLRLLARGQLCALAVLSLLMLSPPVRSFAQAPMATRLASALPDAPVPVATPERSLEQDGAQNGAQNPSHPLPNSSAPQPLFKIGPFRDPKSLDLSMPVVPLSVGDKLRLSLQEQATPFAITSMFFAAGWEQLVGSNPKFGNDSTAYAQRVGAAALRQTSQAVFSDGVFASAFRQDPRYYRLASGSFGKRIFYAASRTWRTRTDSGDPAINYSLLFGHATAQALTLTYYPDRSQTGHVAITGFAWSLLGNALGNQYHEFWPDILRTFLQRPPKGPKPASTVIESKPASTE